MRFVIRQLAILCIFLVLTVARDCPDDLVSLQNWLRQPGTTPFVKLLTLNSNEHLKTIENAWICSGGTALSLSQSIAVMDASKDIQVKVIIDLVGKMLEVRMNSDKHGASLLIIEHAQKLSSAKLHELMNSFYGKSSITVENKSFLLSGLGIVLFSDIGQEEFLQRRSIDQDVKQHFYQDVVYRAIRKIWPNPSHFMFNNYRRVTELVFGEVEVVLLKEFIEKQKESRDETGKIVDFKDGIEFLTNTDFVGQEEVIEKVTTSLLASQRGLKTSRGPLIYLFAGIAGTGKTFLSQLISIAYNYEVILQANMQQASIGEMIDFLGRKNLYLHVDMGNYQDDRAIDGFVDPSPGLQGEGLLSNLYAKGEKRIVVVLDEIEKAHPSLLKDMLLPVLDNNNGHVQKKKTGESFRTQDSIFILTTNCFDDQIKSLYEKKLTYGEIVTRIGVIFEDNSAACLSSQNGNNPFAWKSLWRRISAGQSLATKDAFLAFLPPRLNDIRDLVKIALESLHRKYSKASFGISGLYYSDKVVLNLQRDCGQLENMAEIESVVERIVVNLILQLTDNPEAYVGVLYVNSNKEISLVTVNLEGELISKITTFKDKLSTKSEESHYEVNVNSFKKVSDVSLEKEVTTEEQLEEQANSYSLFRFKFDLVLFKLVSSLIAVAFFSYVFLVPQIKVFMGVISVLSFILYMFFPELFNLLITLLSYLFKALSWIFGSGFVPISLLWFLYVFYTAFIKGDKQVEVARVESSSMDILRRWKLLVLGLERRHKLHTTYATRNILDEGAYFPTSRTTKNQYIFNNCKKLLRSESNPLERGYIRRPSRFVRLRQLAKRMYKK